MDEKGKKIKVEQVFICIIIIKNVHFFCFRNGFKIKFKGRAPPLYGQPCSRTNRSRCRTACDVCFQQKNYIIGATRGKLIKDAHKTVQIVDLNTARKRANARRQKAFLQLSKQAFSFSFFCLGYFTVNKAIITPDLKLVCWDESDATRHQFKLRKPICSSANNNNRICQSKSGILNTRPNRAKSPPPHPPVPSDAPSQQRTRQSRTEKIPAVPPLRPSAPTSPPGLRCVIACQSCRRVLAT